MRRVPRFIVGAVGQASAAGFSAFGLWLGPLALAGIVAFTWTQPSHAQSCGGVERWAVKVGSDAAAPTINLTSPVSTTVHNLIQLPRPTVPSDETTRTSAETTVRVVDARLVKFKLEAGKSGDSDFHLVLADDLLLFSQGQQVLTHGVIAEIVDPGCVAGRNDQVSFPSTFQTQLAAVHTKFVNQFGATIQTDGSGTRRTAFPCASRPSDSSTGTMAKRDGRRTVLSSIRCSTSSSTQPAAHRFRQPAWRCRIPASRAATRDGRPRRV